MKINILAQCNYCKWLTINWISVHWYPNCQRSRRLRLLMRNFLMSATRFIFWVLHSSLTLVLSLPSVSCLYCWPLTMIERLAHGFPFFFYCLCRYSQHLNVCSQRHWIGHWDICSCTCPAERIDEAALSMGSQVGRGYDFDALYCQLSAQRVSSVICITLTFGQSHKALGGLRGALRKPLHTLCFSLWPCLNMEQASNLSWSLAHQRLIKQ